MMRSTTTTLAHPRPEIPRLSKLLRKNDSPATNGVKPRAEADKLIRCPCLDDIRNGACGSSFIGAFRCFILSQEPEKGAECGQKFTELETCMQGNPEMFADAMKKNVVGEDPKLPPVPPAAVRVPEKIAEWSKEF